jgi:hypothetical protein
MERSEQENDQRDEQGEGKGEEHGTIVMEGVEGPTGAEWTEKGAAPKCHIENGKGSPLPFALGPRKHHRRPYRAHSDSKAGEAEREYAQQQVVTEGNQRKARQRDQNAADQKGSGRPMIEERTQDQSSDKRSDVITGQQQTQASQRGVKAKMHGG